MTDFRMPSGWYEPPADHDCPDEPGECECADRAEDARESALMAHDDADRGR